MSIEKINFETNILGNKLPQQKFPGVISESFRYNSETNNYDCLDEGFNDPVVTHESQISNESDFPVKVLIPSGRR